MSPGLLLGQPSLLAARDAWEAQEVARLQVRYTQEHWDRTSYTRLTRTTNTHEHRRTCVYKMTHTRIHTYTRTHTCSHTRTLVPTCMPVSPSFLTPTHALCTDSGFPAPLSLILSRPPPSSSCLHADHFLTCPSSTLCIKLLDIYYTQDNQGT